MLVTVQYPIADARSFTDSAPRLASPNWPLPGTMTEFVRCFGPVERRRRGAAVPDIWSDELYYAVARRAIRFGNLQDERLGHWANSSRVRCVYRRMFCNGRTLARVEVGLTVECPFEHDGRSALALVLQVLNIPVRVAGFRRVQWDTTIRCAGPSLADLFGSCTTPVSEGGEECTFVRAGEISTLIEYEDYEVTGMAPGSKVVAAEHVLGTNLVFTSVSYGRQHIPVWFLQRNDAAKEEVRLVRGAITRLHAERQALREILRMIAAGALIFSPHTAEGDRMEDYLNRSTQLLERHTINGTSNAIINGLLRAYEIGFSGAELPILLDQIAKVRRQIRMKVEAFIRDRQAEPAATYIIVGGNLVQAESFVQGDQRVQSTTINFGQGNTFHGDVIAAGAISRSFTKTMEAEANNTVKESLEEVIKLVAKLCEQQAPERSQETARTLEALVSEATAETPRHDWLKLSAEGLIKAAKTVAEMAAPIATAVKSLVGILGLIL